MKTYREFENDLLQDIRSLGEVGVGMTWICPDCAFTSKNLYKKCPTCGCETMMDFDAMLDAGWHKPVESGGRG